ncbi:hypothetical protein F7734_55315 [Scytonema sp. UIC 10036]|uniref:hypothetical protein n=1 Tax=Scytonema sp. UIC 10036 TaxID=2304196 RepID=UPI0012DA9F40|nr:hypothetical protein [Scytonema sp. UIC 10036]MUH00954.1 hypothetical protein [Scytonema sp. UIC 10036]
MVYDVPGRVDQLSADLVQKWNEAIQAAYANLQPDFGSRFFTLDPSTLTNPIPAPIKWFGDPAEPNFCLGAEVARQLSDWGVRGRHVLHNEYCEYRIIEKADATGRMRPKRVQVTTELREYWVSVATHDPLAVRAMAQSVLGFEPTWEDLYGVSDPLALTEQQRSIAFSTLVAGHGNDNELIVAGVPSQPTGKLNTDNALFMTHPINGLDDLLYIVMFGAKPYASGTPSNPVQATREQLFREFGVEHLACRHADPNAAMGALGGAFNGHTVAFANPLGMYIRSFTKNVFLFKGEPIPDSWVRLSRGATEEMCQRLEFGPGDDEPAFLDDITVAIGGNEEPLTGGFQVVQQMEVGPLVVIGQPTPIAEDEYVILSTSDAPIECQEADVCQTIQSLKQEFDNTQQIVRVAPRTMGFRS